MQRYTTPLERALDSSVIQPVMDERFPYVYDIDNVPAQFLPFIAEIYDADIWDPADDEQVQRNVLKVAYEIHELRGTWESLNRFAAAAGFDYNYTFTQGTAPVRNVSIDIVVTPSVFSTPNAAWLRRLRRVISNLLPMDITLGSLTALTPAESNIYVVIGTQQYDLQIVDA